MKDYKDFSSIGMYTTYINNESWSFTFTINKIIVSNESDYLIYNNRILAKDVLKYDNYMKCFKDIIDELNSLYLCRLCKRYDYEECNICKLNSIIDTLEMEKKIEEDCPVCYNVLTVRHKSICNDSRHLLCGDCYNKVYVSGNCPVCRGNRSIEE